MTKSKESHGKLRTEKTALNRQVIKLDTSYGLKIWIRKSEVLAVQESGEGLIEWRDQFPVGALIIISNHEELLVKQSYEDIVRELGWER